jgi:hypothetical protein
MIKCQTCGTQNLDSSQYCDECGESLQKYVAPEASEVNNIESTDSESSEQEVPIFQSASVTSIGVPPIVEENEEFSTEEKTKVSVPETSLVEREPDKLSNMAPKRVHAKLIIERGQSIGTEFNLSAEESNIGRWDADNGVFPDIDLDAHDSEAKVSRKHARIHYNNGQYLLEDLGSTNGTFINRGRRLIPGSPNVLNDGDEIIVGKTFLRFQIT